MSKKLFMLSLSILLLASMYAQAQSIVFVADKIKVDFFSEARMENIAATSQTGAAAAINNTTRDVAFKVPISSFRFEHKLMEEHFNETYMESDKYPYAIFKGKIAEKVDLTVEGEYPVTVEGTIDVHGVSKPRSFSGTIQNKGGRLFLDSKFLMPVSDHKIDIPNDKLSNISQTIKVTLHAEFIRKK